MMDFLVDLKYLNGNLISVCFNENFFVKKNVMKISIKRSDLNKFDFVKWWNKLVDLGVSEESFYFK